MDRQSKEWIPRKTEEGGVVVGGEGGGGREQPLGKGCRKVYNFRHKSGLRRGKERETMDEGGTKPEYINHPTTYGIGSIDRPPSHPQRLSRRVGSSEKPLTHDASSAPGPGAGSGRRFPLRLPLVGEAGYA